VEILSFYKTPAGSWYIDLPHWTGDQGELLMVAGADTLLDIISSGGNKAKVEVSLEAFAGSSLLKLERLGEGEGGGHYHIDRLGDRSLDLDLWLCDVTNFVFGFIPERIYIKPAHS
jgi:hypothetical protein